jgi:hypothetical protein
VSFPPRRLFAVLLLAPVTSAGTVGAVQARPAAKTAREPVHAKPAARVVAEAFAHRRAHGASGLTGPTRPGSAAPATAATPAPVSPEPAVPGPLSPVVTDPLTSPAVGAPVPSTPTASTALGVQALDTPNYRMLLSRVSVPAGTVRLQLQNGGEDDHNLLLTRTDGTGDAIAVPLTAPGTNRTSILQLTAGTYRLFCTLTTPVVHDTAGMHATLIVTP